MADVTGSGYMGDATGGIGQGVAFVLPEGKAATYAMQLAQTHASQLQALAKQQILSQQKAQAQYAEDFKSQELPKIYAPFDNIIRDRQDKWMQKGATMYANTGVNPFNNSDYVAEHSKDVLGPAAKSTQFGDAVTKVASAIQGDKNGSFSEESKNQWNKWYDDFTNASDSEKMDYLDHPEKHRMPVLKDREVDAGDFIKPLKPSGDQAHNEAQVYSNMYEPKNKDFLTNRYHVLASPDGHLLLDFGLYPKDKSGRVNEKRDFHTDENGVNWIANDILEHPEDPVNAQHIKEYGWDLSKNPDGTYKDHKIEERIKHAVLDSNVAWGHAVTDLSRPLFDPEKAQQLTDQKHTIANQDREYALSQRRFNLAVQEHQDLQRDMAKKFEAIPPFDHAATTLKQAALSGDNVSAKKLADQFVEHIPNKKYKEPITTDITNGLLTIHIPKEHIPSGNGARAYTISVDLSDPNFESVLWAKLKGAGMDVNAFNTANKKGAIPPSATPKKPTNSSLSGWNQ